MSAATATPTTARRQFSDEDRYRVTFGRLVKSEWIKLVSLRSTWWTLGLTVLGMIGLAVMFASTLSFIDDGSGSPLNQIEGLAAQVITFGYFVGQISVAVIGALVITGEYSTGMIRATMTADPSRTKVLLAKAGVLSGVTLVTGLVGIALSYLVTLPWLNRYDLALDFSNGTNYRVLLGTAVYLVLIALLSFGLGLILRSSAGTIAALMSLLFLAPIFVGILAAWAEWAANILKFLPGTAGENMMTLSGVMEDPSVAGTSLTPLQGFLVLSGYVVVALVLGLISARKRDV